VRERIRGLDELRGIAILLVVMVHMCQAAGIPLSRTPPTFEGPTSLPADESAGSVHGSIDGLGPLRYDGTIELLGWAADLASETGPGITALTLNVDTMPVAVVQRIPERADLRAALGERFASAGWSARWDVTDWPPGPHQLELVVQAERGTVAHLTRPVTLHDPLVWPWDVPIPYGGIGVHLFFIISGFLITTILVTTKERPGYLSIFYTRRALRILPLALVAIGVSYALFPATRSFVVPYLLFFNNYTAQTTGQIMEGLRVLWSLAVEEQFYVVWPLIVMVMPRRHLWLVLGGIVLTSWTWCLLARTDAVIELYSLDWRTHLEVYVIGIGGWLALLRQGLVPRPRLCLGVLAGWLAFVVLVLGGHLRPLEPPILGLFGVAVWLAVTGRFVLSVAPLRWLGVHCYGLYLVHMFVNMALTAYLPEAGAVLFAALSLGGSAGLAAISYRWFEQPLLRLAPRYGPETARPAPILLPGIGAPASAD
jgi:peptidoglycan/LPS O-acetylase OafA/YrhL